MNIHLNNHKNESFNNKGSRPSAIRSLANESGAVLIVALILMAVMIAMVPAALQLTTAEIDRTQNFQEERDAFFIADAGIEHAKSIFAVNAIDDVLFGTDQDVTTFTDNGTFTAGGTGPTVIAGSTAVTATSKIDNATHNYTQVAYNDGTYLIRVWDNDDSALCPADSGGTVLCTSGEYGPRTRHRQ